MDRAGLFGRIMKFLKGQRRQDAREGVINPLATRLAAGTAFVTLLLAFFGVRDAIPDGILREEPRATLLFSFMILASIAGAIVVRQMAPKDEASKSGGDGGHDVASPVADEAQPAGGVHASKAPGTDGVPPAKQSMRRRSYRAPLTLFFVLLVVALYPVASNIARYRHPSNNTNLVLLLCLAAAATAIVAAFAWKAYLQLLASILIVVATVFALGTYGAVRLAVDSKSTIATPEIKSPVITAREDGSLRLTATVDATGVLSCYQMFVRLGELTVTTSRANASGSISSPLDLTVNRDMLSRTGTVVVTALLEPEKQSDDRRCIEAQGEGARTSSVELPVVSPLAAPTLAVEWSDGESLMVTASAPVGRRGRYADIVIGATKPGECEVLSQAIVPLGDGGPQTAKLPATVPATFDEVRVRAIFGDVPAIPASRTDCTSMEGPADSTMVVRRPRPPDPGEQQTLQETATALHK